MSNKRVMFFLLHASLEWQVASSSACQARLTCHADATCALPCTWSSGFCWSSRLSQCRWNKL